jgi:hypothetical protein
LNSNGNDQKRTAGHIIVKMPKLDNKERILKASQEKLQLTYKGKHIRITSELSSQTLTAKKAWSNITQVLRENNCRPTTLQPARLSFNNSGKTGIMTSKVVHVHQACITDNTQRNISHRRGRKTITNMRDQERIKLKG